MCGRYSLETPLDGLKAWLKPWLLDDDRGWLAHYAPRPLIRPGEPVLTLRHEHGRSRTAHMLWGLLPGWVKDPSAGPRPINARAETLAEKAFCPPMGSTNKVSRFNSWKHRCSGWLASGTAGSVRMAAKWKPAA